MTYKELISIFKSMLENKWGYVLGTSGVLWTKEKAESQNKGKNWIGHYVADCSGAFVYALRKANMSIYHGSNRIARVHVDQLRDLPYVEPGMIVFKKKDPGQEGYNLPNEYRIGGKYYNGDLADYYHCGLYYGDGKVINLQSPSTGCVVSPLSQNWSKCGRLKGIDYDKEDSVEFRIELPHELAKELYEHLKGVFE